MQCRVASYTRQRSSWNGQSRKLQAVHRGVSRAQLQCHCLNIDRRLHLELSWKRQQEREERDKNVDLSQGSNGVVVQVDDLQHLEILLEKAGSNTVILFFTSRTCGVCKSAAQRFQSMCADAAAARARVVFLQADVHNEYDQYSDLARYHRVKAVPTFLFFDEGAVIKRLSLRDVRRLTGTTDWIQSALADDMKKLQMTLFEVLVKRAPSTRQ